MKNQTTQGTKQHYTQSQNPFNEGTQKRSLGADIKYTVFIKHNHQPPLFNPSSISKLPPTQNRPKLGAMLNLKDYYVWNKDQGSNLRLSKNFMASEFSCRCDKDLCETQRISRKLVSSLQLIRDFLGEPITVTSGFRCSEYQKRLKKLGYNTARNVSQHELGNASDLTCHSLKVLYELCEREFEAIGDGRKKGFIHVDTRQGKKRRWGY